MTGESTLFLFDPRVTESTRNLKTVVGRPQKAAENPLFDWAEKPVYRNYPNVFRDPQGTLRCYYTVVLEAEEGALQGIGTQQGKETGAWPDRRMTALAYAVSRDGIRWERPRLGLVSYRGSAQNNLIRLYAHGSCVFYDSDEQCPERRYKLITRDDREPAGMCAAFSEDGIHFGEYVRLELNPGIIGDTHNFCFYDRVRKEYVLTTRTFSGTIRLVSGCFSRDFLNWSQDRVIFRGDDLDDQAYSMPVFYYSGLYFGLASMFHGSDMDSPVYDKVECELVCGTDTSTFSRIAPHKPFIPLGEEAESDNGCVYLSAPVECGDEFWFYYTGARGWHRGFTDASLHLARLKKSRLAGLHSREKEKEAVLRTRPLMVLEDMLNLNADVEAGGYVRARLLDPEGEEVPGYGYDEFDLIGQGTGERRITWNGGKSPGPGREYLLEFVSRGAGLFQISGAGCRRGNSKNGR